MYKILAYADSQHSRRDHHVDHVKPFTRIMTFYIRGLAGNVVEGSRAHGAVVLLASTTRIYVERKPREIAGLVEPIQKILVNY